MTPQASVIIPTYKDWAGLQHCLDALAAQTVRADDIEVIVANNNPDATVPASLRLAKNMRVIWAQQPGSYAARNAALSHVQADAIFFTDSDCLPGPDWISAGLAALATQPDISRFAGRVDLFPAGAAWTTCEAFDRIFSLNQQKYASLGYAATANLLVRRSAFGVVGPFDASLFSSGDKEWNLRAKAAGLPIAYLDEMRVRHPARASFASLAKKRRRVAEGKLRLKKRQGFLTYLKPIKFLLPSMNGTLRILRANQFPLKLRLAVIWLSYKLRLDEGITLAKLRYGDGRPTHRE